MIRFFSFYKKTIVIIMLITLASLMSFENIDPNEIPKIPHLDKVVHFMMYLTLTFTFMWENFSRHQYHVIMSRFILIVVVVTAIGITMELLQAGITVSRSGNVADAVANSIGLTVGMILFRVTKNNSFIKNKVFKV